MKKLVLSLLIYLTTTSVVYAQNYNLPFRGNVPRYCRVDNIKEGVLGLNPSSDNELITTTPSEFTVVCNFPIINVSIGSTLTDTNSVDGESLSGLVSAPRVYGEGLDITGFNSSAVVTGVGGLNKVFSSSLNLVAIDGIVDAGDYNYNLPITVIPQ